MNSVERKLTIFDLLLVLLKKEENLKDNLKKYFNRIIECYSIIIIYFSLLSKNDENNFASFISSIEELEYYEEKLKKNLFTLLTHPGKLKSNFNKWKNQYIEIEDKIFNYINQKYKYVRKNTPHLFKRVIATEINNLNIFSLLKRFQYETFQ